MGQESHTGALSPPDHILPVHTPAIISLKRK